MPIERVRVREVELYKSAAYLFNKSGYTSTSIRTICKTIGIRESSLYHYIRSKEELLFNICENAMVVSLKAVEPIANSGLDSELKLKKMIHVHTAAVARNSNEHYTMIKELRALNPRNRRKITKLRDRYEALFRKVIEDCVHDKSFRKLNSKMVAFALLGMMNSFIRWYSPEGPVESASLAKIFSDLFFNGVKK
jgi:AcrR family transcriptional regulator